MSITCILVKTNSAPTTFQVLHSSILSFIKRSITFFYSYRWVSVCSTVSYVSRCNASLVGWATSPPFGVQGPDTAANYRTSASLLLSAWGKHWHKESALPSSTFLVPVLALLAVVMVSHVGGWGFPVWHCNNHYRTSLKIGHSTTLFYWRLYTAKKKLHCYLKQP